MERKQPLWKEPINVDTPVLKVYNSLTRTKVPFITQKGKKITWYSCGPTVYDASHFGHAWSYVTFDIIRRILEDYFNYDVLLVMNITDIDDKIILRARQNYLLEQYKKENTLLTAEMISHVHALWVKQIEKKLGAKFEEGEKEKDVDSILTLAKERGNKQDELFQLNFENLRKIGEAIQKAKEEMAKAKEEIGKAKEEIGKAKEEIGTEKGNSSSFIDAAGDLISAHLDALKGAEITDHEIFNKLSRYWENEYLNDMDALNVKRADILTRVSEYVPEIIQCIEGIIKNGYGYESNGSVYFDVAAYHNKNGHFYAKLCPWSANNTKLNEEGEGALSLAAGNEKKSPFDFALWKKSKPGEPKWPSPWSQGRPGWHIECSAMASDVIGGTIDIHSGGIDLAFPHHDNELAQSEACYEMSQWINYFLHAGHLHIEGQKMSKSLKNFVSIKEALSKYTARQVRILFLQHEWSSVLDFKESSMTAAISMENNFLHFFATMDAVVREGKQKGSLSNAAHNFREEEKQLLAHLLDAQSKVHSSLCDSFNTPAAMQALLELINLTNVYCMKKKENCSHFILLKVSSFIRKILQIFGVFKEEQEAKDDSAMMKVLDAVSNYRDSVRDLAIKKADHKEFLALSDKLRDESLLSAGVLLEDRENSKALVKLVDAETVLRIRNEKKQKEQEKEQRREQLALLQKERLERGRMAPAELFKTDEFIEWDEQGIPLKDKDGQEVSKSRRKKMMKEYEAQQKLHNEFLSKGDLKE